eukprot:26911_4
MIGTLLARSGTTWSCICRTFRAVLVHLMILLRMPLSTLLLHALLGLELSLRNVRACG